jgi:hypothetical protein
MVLLLVALATGAARAADLKNRSTSRTGQFIVYCDDREVRSRVVSSVEEIKADLLHILQASDEWDFPIIISIDRAEPGKPETPVSLQLTNTLAGPKIDIGVRIGNDPARVFLQRHIVRALLLEMAYRDRANLKQGERYTEPPWWLAEGFLQAIRRHADSGGTDIFKSIVNTDKLPELEKFLSHRPTLLDTAAGAVDSACALCLVEALMGLPNGSQNMQRFIRRSPEAATDPLAVLAVQFPVLSGSPQSLAKWWALQIARYANADRWEGMSLEETEKELAAALTLEIPIDKSGKTQKFDLAHFADFVKLKEAKGPLMVARVKVAALAARAHPLFRSVITEYEQICGELSVKKTKGISERITAMENYRSALVQRMGQIQDYLNWYEATQAEGSAEAFQQYLARAREAAAPPPLPPVDPKVSSYLDALEKDFQPLFPNTLPGAAPTGVGSR